MQNLFLGQLVPCKLWCRIPRYYLCVYVSVCVHGSIHVQRLHACAEAGGQCWVFSLIVLQFNFLYMSVYVYAGVHQGVVVPTVARKECHNPWSWNYRRLCASCGYWELNWVLWKSIKCLNSCANSPAPSTLFFEAGTLTESGAQ